MYFSCINIKMNKMWICCYIIIIITFLLILKERKHFQWLQGTVLYKPAVRLHLLKGEGEETQSRGKLIIENCPRCPALAIFIKNWLKSGGLAQWAEWLTAHVCDLILMLGAHVRKLPGQVSIRSPNIPTRKWAGKYPESNMPMIKWEAEMERSPRSFSRKLRGQLTRSMTRSSRNKGDPTSARWDPPHKMSSDFHMDAVAHMNLPPPPTPRHKHKNACTHTRSEWMDAWNEGRKVDL